MKISTQNISPTFCVLPWIHLSTRPNGQMRLCCTANASSAGAKNDKNHGIGVLKDDDGQPANLNTTDLLSGWNNQYMKDVRQNMLHGKIPPSCSKCFKEEAAGHRSKRNWENEYWDSRMDVSDLLQQTSIDGTVPAQIHYLDLRLGTKCNLKCVMCSPHDSSLWVSDWNKLFPQITHPALKENFAWKNKGKLNGASYDWHKDNPKFWEQLYLQIPHLQQLYFAGGESTIIEEHYTLLEECIRRGEAHHIHLRYNSNGLELPDRLFKLWKHFPSVRFHISLDSFGEMNSYIRYPSNWDHMVQQLHKLDQTDSNVEITIACAVQALNIYYLPDFIKWKLEQNFKKINLWPRGAGLMNFHFVYHPMHLNVKVLPHWMKQKIQDKYEAFYPWLLENYRTDESFLKSDYGIRRLQGMVRFMNSEDWSNRLPEFQQYIQLIDKVRGTDFCKIFPEMAGLLSFEQPSLENTHHI